MSSTNGNVSCETRSYTFCVASVLLFILFGFYFEFSVFSIKTCLLVLFDAFDCIFTNVKMFKPKRRIAERPGPLVFNEIYGKGLAMSGDSRQVTRLSGFGDAIVFSNRRVRSTEKIFLRHRQKNVDWIGSLRIGFCVEDPKTKFTRETLPNLAFKNLSGSKIENEILFYSPVLFIFRE